MKKLACIVVAVTAVLSGCSANQMNDTGDFSRNVVYRDLTRPIGVDNEPVKADYVTPLR